MIKGERLGILCRYMDRECTNLCRGFSEWDGVEYCDRLATEQARVDVLEEILGMLDNIRKGDDTTMMEYVEMPSL